MKDTIYIIFTRRGYVRTVKTPPKNEHFITLHIAVDEKYFAKHVLETTLHVDDKANLTLEEFQVEINRIKKGL